MKTNAAVSLTSFPQIRTITTHLSSDLEANCMVWLVKEHSCVRRVLGVKEYPNLKYIPAGPLRHVDWIGVTRNPTPDTLRRAGHVTFDCGGGPYDQHALAEAVADNRTSSLHLLLADIAARLDDADMRTRTEIRGLFSRMRVIFDTVSRSDLFGEDIAPRSLDEVRGAMVAAMVAELGVETDVATQEAATVSSDKTPHTQRHLRNMIIGWNRKYATNPEAVTRLACTAFSCIEANLSLLSEEELNDPSEPDIRKMFRAEEIVMGAEMHFRNLLGDDASDEAVAEAVAEYKAEVDSALETMEAEWQLGERDYWGNARHVEVAMQPQEEGRNFRRVSMVSCISTSQRLGSVCRQGNVDAVRWVKDDSGKKKPVVVAERPYPNRDMRGKADVVIQFYPDENGRYAGRFVISTRSGIRLDRVAAALREADLRVKEVEITDEVRAQLTSPGNFTYVNRNGRTVESIYFANFRTAVGNYFRANPYSQCTALGMGDIAEITRRVLETSFEAPTSRIAADALNEGDRRQARRA